MTPAHQKPNRCLSVLSVSMRSPTSLRARTPAAAGNDRLVSSLGWGVAFVLGQLGSQPWDSAATDAVLPEC
jgi:hypothetical protein